MNRCHWSQAIFLNLWINDGPYELTHSLFIGNLVVGRLHYFAAHTIHDIAVFVSRLCMLLDST